MIKRSHCVVITAYKDVNMLRCLLKTLHDKMLCYVHVDQRSWDAFRCLEAEFPDVNIQYHDKVGGGGGTSKSNFRNVGIEL